MKISAGLKKKQTNRTLKKSRFTFSKFVLFPWKNLVAQKLHRVLRKRVGTLFSILNLFCALMLLLSYYLHGCVCLGVSVLLHSSPDFFLVYFISVFVVGRSVCFSVCLSVGWFVGCLYCVLNSILIATVQFAANFEEI